MAYQLEVFSAGNVTMLETAFNGVAAISRDSAFLSMAALGGMVCLLLSAVRFFSTGRFEPQQLLVAWVAWAIVFVPKVDVAISDVYSTDSRLVSNVPVGLAAPLAITSQIGRYLSTTFETAFGYHSQYGTSQKGYMDPLVVILKMRTLSLQNVNGVNDQANMHQALSSYIRQCVRFDMEKAAAGLGTPDTGMAKILSAESAWSAMSTNLSNVNIEMDVPGVAGGYRVYTCPDAYTALTQAFADEDGSWYRATFRPYIARVLGGYTKPSDADVTQRIGDAQAAIGLATTSARNYALNSVIGYMLSQNPVSDSASQAAVQNALIKAQAMNQRATEWATEKSMFETVSRQIAAFGEMFCVAAGPILSFAIMALGIQGLAMMGKFLMLHVWVVLWQPVLSISDLYIYTKVNEWVEIAQNADGLSLLSISGQSMVNDVLQAWVATGSMLAATTPMLTLFLISGSWQVATGIAGRLQGKEHIDTSLASPTIASGSSMFKVGETGAVTPGIGGLNSAMTLPTLELSLGAGTTNQREARVGQATTASESMSLGANVGTRVSFGESGDEVRSMRSGRETALSNAINGAVEGVLSTANANGLKVGDEKALRQQLTETLTRGFGLNTRGEDVVGSGSGSAPGSAPGVGPGAPANAQAPGGRATKVAAQLAKMVDAQMKSVSADGITSSDGATRGEDQSVGLTKSDAVKKAISDAVSKVQKVSEDHGFSVRSGTSTETSAGHGQSWDSTVQTANSSATGSSYADRNTTNVGFKQQLTFPEFAAALIKSFGGDAGKANEFLGGMVRDIADRTGLRGAADEARRFTERTSPAYAGALISQGASPPSPGVLKGLVGNFGALTALSGRMSADDQNALATRVLAGFGTGSLDRSLDPGINSSALSSSVLREVAKPNPTAQDVVGENARLMAYSRQQLGSYSSKSATLWTQGNAAVDGRVSDGDGQVLGIHGDSKTQLAAHWGRSVELYQSASPENRTAMRAQISDTWKGFSANQQSLILEGHYKRANPGASDESAKEWARGQREDINSFVVPDRVGAAIYSAMEKSSGTATTRERVQRESSER